MGFIAKVIAAVGSKIAKYASVACWTVILDEPECPKSLIK